MKTPGKGWHYAPLVICLVWLALLGLDNWVFSHTSLGNFRLENYFAVSAAEIIKGSRPWSIVSSLFFLSFPVTLALSVFFLWFISGDFFRLFGAWRTGLLAVSATIISTLTCYALSDLKVSHGAVPAVTAVLAATGLVFRKRLYRNLRMSFITVAAIAVLWTGFVFDLYLYRHVPLSAFSCVLPSLGGALAATYLWITTMPVLEGIYRRIEIKVSVMKMKTELKNQQILDSLLQRIARGGLDSLTGREKRFLKKMSDREQNVPRSFSKKSIKDSL